MQFRVDIDQISGHKTLYIAQKLNISLPSVVFVLLHIQAIASQHEGNLANIDFEFIAAATHVDVISIKNIYQILIKIGMIDDNQYVDYQRLVYKNSTDRSKKHRNKKRQEQQEAQELPQVKPQQKTIKTQELETPQEQAETCDIVVDTELQKSLRNLHKVSLNAPTIKQFLIDKKEILQDKNIDPEEKLIGFKNYYLQKNGRSKQGNQIHEWDYLFVQYLLKGIKIHDSIAKNPQAPQAPPDKASGAQDKYTRKSKIDKQNALIRSHLLSLDDDIAVENAIDEKQLKAVN